jgi:hypothetical protein
VSLCELIFFVLVCSSFFLPGRRHQITAACRELLRHEKAKEREEKKTGGGGGCASTLLSVVKFLKKKKSAEEHVETVLACFCCFAFISCLFAISSLFLSLHLDARCDIRQPPPLPYTVVAVAFQVILFFVSFCALIGLLRRSVSVCASVHLPCLQHVYKSNDFLFVRFFFLNFSSSP